MVRFKRNIFLYFNVRITTSCASLYYALYYAPLYILKKDYSLRNRVVINIQCKFKKQRHCVLSLFQINQNHLH